MATKKCQVCGKPATHHVKKWENNIETDYSLCDGCAEEKGLAPEGGKESGLAETLGEMLEGMEGVGEGAVGTVECPRCHLPYSSFRQNGRLGCPYCYTAFDKQLRPLLRRVHGALRHTGKAPSGTDEHAARRQELRRLQDEMERAVARDEFEKAAALRDQIRKLKSAAAAETTAGEKE